MRRIIIIKIAVLAFLVPVFNSLGIAQQAVVSHIKLMQELHAKFAQQPNFHIDAEACGLPPTEAYLSVPHLKAAVEKKFGKQINSLGPIIQEIQAHEQEFFATHYVFYHGQRLEFVLFQDIIKEIMAWLTLMPAKNFEYVRLPGSDFAIDQNIYDYVDQRIKIYDKRWLRGWFDCNPQNRKVLLSVNLSLFGNTTKYGESTFHYFATSKSCLNQETSDFIESFFKQTQLNPAYIQQLYGEFNILKAKSGLLLQIFVPRQDVDKYVYLAKPGGWFYDSTKKSIAPVLNLCSENPAAIADIDRLQARFLITNTGLLNPNSGIKMYRYINTEKELLNNYYKNIKKIVDDMMCEWLKNHTDFSNSENHSRSNSNNFLARIKKALRLPANKTKTIKEPKIMADFLPQENRSISHQKFPFERLVSYMQNIK